MIPWVDHTEDFIPLPDLKFFSLYGSADSNR